MKALKEWYEEESTQQAIIDTQNDTLNKNKLVETASASMHIRTFLDCTKTL